MCYTQDLSGVCDMCSLRYDSTFEVPVGRQVQCNRVPPRRHYTTTLITCPHCNVQTVMRQCYDLQVAVQYLITLGTGDAVVRSWATLATLDQASLRLIAHHGQAYHVRRAAMGWPFNGIEHPAPRRPATDFATILQQRTPELEAAAPHQRTRVIPEDRQVEIDVAPLRIGSTARAIAAARKTQAKAATAIQSLARVMRSASINRSASHGNRPSTSDSRPGASSYQAGLHTYHGLDARIPDDAGNRTNQLTRGQGNAIARRPATANADSSSASTRFSPLPDANNYAAAPELHRSFAVRRTNSEAVRIRQPSRMRRIDDSAAQTGYITVGLDLRQVNTSIPGDHLDHNIGSARPQTADASSKPTVPLAVSSTRTRTVHFAEPQRARTVSSRPVTGNQSSNSRAFAQNSAVSTTPNPVDWTFTHNHGARANNFNVAAHGPNTIRSPLPQRTFNSAFERWNNATPRQEGPLRPPTPIFQTKTNGNSSKGDRAGRIADGGRSNDESESESSDDDAEAA